MKNIILLLLVYKGYVQEGSTNDSFLTKFHQNQYKIRDIRTELTSYDENTFNFLEVKTFKYNRTTPTINVTLNLKVDLKDKTEVLTQGYKYLSNEYRYFPLRFQTSLSKLLAVNALGLSNVYKCGKFSFYFYKDITYHTCNFVIDDTKLPPLMPTGSYKMEFTMLYLNKEIMVLNVFGEVYIPIVYPKK